ncbi:hypothetical protein QWY75_04440 [Pontixanthobacter aestiaquae]|uniref:LysR family transcriptional regulator n=1 Tax=Pontixanthobacter aestiaquae TaxID=1509367 RepID=A0A844Z976_9SPHN|nr:hypothetical protein [Pontixanthobacter aestiaquae]MDN3645457.1 hypothetical protein [Pontixanthobacter aestiaquae]MXO83543.1 hypothetical protein [Pontixanthobacter aestiaquae]
MSGLSSGMDHHQPSPDSSKTRRSNADYRWTVPKVRAFLGALAKYGRVSEAARAVGMSRQSAYKLRARLNGQEFRAVFEEARAQGLNARAVAKLEQTGSRWDGPGLAALDHLRADHGLNDKSEITTAQGDTIPAQGDT